MAWLPCTPSSNEQRHAIFTNIQRSKSKLLPSEEQRAKHGRWPCARENGLGARQLSALRQCPRGHNAIAGRGNRTRPGAEPERRARRPCARLPLVKPLSTLPARGAAEAKHNPQIPVHEAAVQQTHGGGRLAGPTAQGRRREDHGHHEREKPTLSGRRAVRKQHHTFGQASGSCRRPPSGVRDEWRGA
jgi:hypothetical protein